MAEYFQDLCGRVRSLDPDEVFAYNTIKVVKVKDRYLGIMRLLMLLGIFLYIVVYVLIVQKKYLQTEVPVGTVYTTLLKPSNTTYIWQYPYCKVYNGSTPVHYQKDCVVWDEQQVLFPADEPNSMLLTTRTYQSYQYAQCPDLMQGCARPYSAPAVKPPVNFIADIEEFTVMCEHSFQAREFYLQTHDDAYSASSGQMEGKLVDSNGNTLQHFSQGRDIISVGTFLQAAGIQLDAPSTSENANKAAGESIRSAGIVLIVYIAYDNGGSGKASYVYNVAAIPSSEYKTVESVYINETTRLSVDRHGIKLVFMTVGTIGRFDFQTALIQLVSAVGLLSVSTVVVELFMLYIMPHRRFYNKYKYEETVDFSDVRDAEHETAADDRFTASLHSDLAELRRQQLLDPSL